MRGARPVALALGSNLGDRLGHLQHAVDALAATPEVSLHRLSAVYETDPVGGPEQPDYLNAVVVGETSLPAAALLHCALEIELGAGRVRQERWGPRTLDIDLLMCGEERSRGDFLTLPHPRAAERAFVLVPWCDAAPEAELPGAGRVADLLGRLPEAAVRGVRRRDDLALRL